MNYKKHIWCVHQPDIIEFIKYAVHAYSTHYAYGKEAHSFLLFLVCLFFCVENSSTALITLAKCKYSFASCMQYMYQFTLQVDLSFYQPIRCKVFRMECEYVLSFESVERTESEGFVFFFATEIHMALCVKNRNSHTRAGKVNVWKMCLWEKLARNYWDYKKEVSCFFSRTPYDS